MRNLKPNFILMALDKELKNHDWLQRVPEEQERIRMMVEDAYATGADPSRLFYEYYPVEQCDNHKKYGIKISWEEAMDRVAIELEKETSVN